MLLEVKDLTVNYGAVKAIEDASIDINEGEIVALIGPNGAGKSTVLKAISGLLDQYNGNISRGEVLLEGKSIRGIATHDLITHRIALVPEGRQLFPSMTVKENLEMGAFACKDKASISEDIENALSLFTHLKDRLKQKAGTLSTGEQQMLALARALMMKPKLLLADEPSLGLSPNYVELIFDKISEINKSGVSILLVEQNAAKALEVSHRAYVFDVGKIGFSDKKENLLNNSRIQDTFLGG